MKVTPLYDNILVKRVEEVKQVGSIYIPDAAREKPQQGEVLEVGIGRRLESGQIAPLLVQPGQTILFAKYAGMEVKVGDEECLILQESSVLGIITEA